MKPNFGVIVGRFQVDNLHDGHLALFRKVSARHNQVIVFIGVNPGGLSTENPLSFQARRRMIEEKFPAFEIHPLQDKKTDERWSQELDARIADLVQYGDVTLYGGRDCFAPHYSGCHSVKELDLECTISGTEVREKITNNVIASSEFRAGMIHAINQAYPRVITTVDVAIMHYDGTDVSILLGRKEGEEGWRFVGGHADPGSISFEEDAKREAFEEVAVDLNSIRYVGSRLIDDWRWRASKKDKIKTMLFLGNTISQSFQAGDDIHEAKWFSFSAVKPEDLEREHRPLLEMLCKHLGKAESANV